MKKTLAILLLLVGVVGCGKSDQQQNEQSNQQVPAASAQDNPNLSKCPDCEGKVSKRAKACPHCGAPLTQQARPPEPARPEVPRSGSGQSGQNGNAPPSTVDKTIVNGVGMKLTLIPAGTFIMGSPETEKDRHDDEIQHKVTITKAFYMQTTEVTQGQWKAVMGTEPWKGKSYGKERSDYPAVYVSWDDAVAYCKKLSEKEGKTYRLPTEAQWEYACRAGTKTTRSFGNNENALGDYAWYEKNAQRPGEKYAHQVGLKKPNAFGLYDMHGNVYEWCHDYYGEDYYQQSPEKDPTGPTSGSSRVLRGGSWYHNSRFTRSALRISLGAGSRYGLGFRLVRELD